MPDPKPDFSKLFLMGDEVPACPKCGTRTEMILDFSHTSETAQIHGCLAADCGFEFVLVEDNTRSWDFEIKIIN